jgi:hypothetical protein
MEKTRKTATSSRPFSFIPGQDFIDVENGQENLRDDGAFNQMEHRGNGNQNASLEATGDQCCTTSISDAEGADTTTMRIWSVDGKMVLREMPLHKILIGLEANLSPKYGSRELQKVEQMDCAGQVRRLRRAVRQIDESSGLARGIISTNILASSALRNITPNESIHQERMAPGGGSMTSPTSPKNNSSAAYPDPARLAFVPASTPLQLAERIESLEYQAKSVGDWDKIFEETGDPKMSEPKYCAALFNMERVKKIKEEFNARYDALLRGEFTKIGANGKLVRSPRPNLPYRYHFRPKKPISPSATTSVSTEHHTNPANSAHNIEGVNEESTEGGDLVESSAFLGWKNLGLTMGNKPGSQRASGQSASLGKKKQVSTFYAQQ